MLKQMSHYQIPIWSLNIAEKEKIAIERIQAYEPPEGYFVGFSGGKDSLVVYHLVKKANVKASFYYNFTYLDYPETVRFIKQNFKDVILLLPRYSFWSLLEKYGPPTRWQRWCCGHLKKDYIRRKTKLLGIRREESLSRKNKQVYEFSKRDNSYHVYPIVDWSETDVWEYIKINNLKYNPLYDAGFKRIGCRFCPFKTKLERLRDAERYPEFKALIIRHLAAFLERTRKRREIIWRNAEELFEWWIKS